MRAFVAGIVLFVCIQALAQCPTPDFSVASSACIDQKLSIENLSSGATSYEWDFCSGDFQTNPVASPILTNSSLTQAWSIRLVNDQGNWYGFSISVTLNKLFRFDFGNSLNNAPSMIDLGNPSNLINGATDFQLVKEGTNWYALIPNTNINRLLRLSFGSSLTTTPTAVDLGTLSSSLNSPNGIVIIQENGNTTAFIANGGVSQIVRADFGSSITNSPASQVMNVPGGSGLRGLAFTKECDRWYGLALSYSNAKVFYLDFNNGLAQPFQSGELTFFSGYAFPATLSMNHEGGSYYTFIQSALGSVYRLSHGTSIIDGTGSGIDLGNLGISNSNFAQTWAQDGTNWFGFSIDRENGRLVRITLPVTCNASTTYSTLSTPPLINYSASGSKLVTLKAKNANGGVQTMNKTVTVSSSVSPDIDFTTQNVCANHDVFFMSQNVSGNIVSYNWDFDDSNSSSQPNPIHQYSSSGIYNVNVEVVASNGCMNTIQHSLTIFNEPIADFDLPMASPFCSNQNYVFTNISTVDSGYPTNWEWRVNGTLISSTEDLSYTFTNTSNQEIRLKALIPGCENEKTENISSLVEGPLPDFSFTGHCENADVVFTNASTGAIDGYAWDFGDGQNAATANPTHIFNDNGTFNVQLTVSNVAGCNNSTSKQVVVYSQPQINFAAALPPFSCSGTPTQFNDLTPGPPDSNITSWQWNFGDPGSGSQNTSALKNPQHTYALAGNYNVSLTVSTNFLCSATLQLPVTISQTPVVDFTHAALCEDSPVNFSGTSASSIQSWSWMIGGSSYSGQNPSHTFNNPGNSTASVMGTATNNCIGSVSKPLTILTKLTPDFSFTRNCVDQHTTFTDVTNATADPVATQSWNFVGLGNATGSPVNFTFSDEGNQPVTLTIATQSGCSYAITKSVTILPSPRANFTAVSQPNTPLTIQYTNSSNNATSFLWAFHDSNNTTSTQVSPQFTYPDFGQYHTDLTASNSQGCFHSTSQLINVVVPVLDVALNGMELIETGTDTFRPAVTIFNHGNVPVSNFRLIMDASGSISDELITETISPNSSYRHMLSLEITDTRQLQYVCLEADVQDVSASDNKTCINMGESLTVFPPYPNPARQDLYVDWISTQDGEVRMSLINGMGQEVRNVIAGFGEGLSPVTFDIRNLESGPYYLRVQLNQFVKTYKVIVLE